MRNVFEGSFVRASIKKKIKQDGNSKPIVHRYASRIADGVLQRKNFLENSFDLKFFVKNFP